MCAIMCSAFQTLGSGIRLMSYAHEASSLLTELFPQLLPLQRKWCNLWNNFLRTVGFSSSVIVGSTISMSFEALYLVYYYFGNLGNRPFHVNTTGRLLQEEGRAWTRCSGRKWHQDASCPNMHPVISVLFLSVSCLEPRRAWVNIVVVGIIKWMLHSFVLISSSSFCSEHKALSQE